MIDIHSHILPSLDDGSQDMGKSLIMAAVAVETGITAMIATPHCNQKNVFENYSSPELYGRMEEFRKELSESGIELEVCLGAEVYATPDILRLYREKKLITLNGSRYMLVEFDFFAKLPFMENTLYSLLDEGIVPILAHPERYVEIQKHPDAAMIWHEESVGIQLNKGSLFGKFGREAYYLSRVLLDSGNVSCIASDAHGTQHRTTDMSDAEAFLSMEYSEKTAELLLTENPERIMRDRELLNMESIIWN